MHNAVTKSVPRVGVGDGTIVSIIIVGVEAAAEALAIACLVKGQGVPLLIIPRGARPWPRERPRVGIGLGHPQHQLCLSVLQWHHRCARLM